MPDPQSGHQRFLVLDSFRGLCAVCVVIFHLHISGAFSEIAWFRGSGLMVEFFFTLSGFVLAHSYIRRDFTLPQLRGFLIGRSMRIFPLHLAVLLAFTLIETARVLAWHAGISYLGRPFSGVNGIEQWLPNLLLLQAWLPDTSAFSFNSPAWSISVEYWLYLLFGALLLATRQLRFAWLALAGLAGLVTIKAAPELAQSGVFRGAFCFVVGSLTYWLHRRWQDRPLTRAWADVAEPLLLLLLYALVTTELEDKSQWATLLFAGILLLFAREAGWVSQLLRCKPLVRLGEWSYSIYLLHFLLIVLLQLGLVALAYQGGPVWVRNGAQGLIFDTRSLWGNQLLLAGFIATLLLLARASYQRLELPAIALGRQWQQNGVRWPRLRLAWGSR